MTSTRRSCSRAASETIQILPSAYDRGLLITMVPVGYHFPRTFEALSNEHNGVRKMSAHYSSWSKKA